MLCIWFVWLYVVYSSVSLITKDIGKFGIAAAVLLLLIGIPKYFIEACTLVIFGVHLFILYTALSKTEPLGSEVFKKSVGSDIVKLVINAITIIVVAVPEGLPLAVTIVRSILVGISVTLFRLLLMV